MVPSASSLKSKAKGLYGQKLGKEGEEYLDALFDKVSSGWKAWQDSIKVGTLIVKGGGVGGWSGSGSGGKMSAQPFNLEKFTFNGNSPQQIKFSEALGESLKEKFAVFPNSYSCISVNFTGSCGATPTSPGPVSAASVAAILSVAGKGTTPSGIQDVWKKKLTPPEFQLDNPQAKSGELMKAIAGAIEQSFQSVWLITAQIQANNISCAATPGGVVAGFSSAFDGKIV